MSKAERKEKKAAKKLRKLERKQKKEKKKFEKLEKKEEKRRLTELKAQKTSQINAEKSASISKENLPAIDVTNENTTKIDDLTTPFRKKRLQMLISLLPHSLSNIHQNVQNRISTLLLKYTDGVGGVLLTYSNLKYSEYQEGGIGKIWGESPYIHYKVEMDALVFEACVGMKFTGVVNECFPSHVGMLVHSFFNAMIPSQLLLNGYEFDSFSQKWVKLDNGQDNGGLAEIGINDEVLFEVEKIHECAGLISIEGKLLG